MSIRDVLIPALRAEFGESSFHVDSPPKPIVTFSARCPDVGDLTIYDDGDEATVVIEHVTHHHVNPYDATLSDMQAATWITERVIEFIRDLFADRIVLWAVDRGQGGGGWSCVDKPVTAWDGPAGSNAFVWSGPITTTEETTSTGSDSARLLNWLRRRES
ncbi:MAG: hypothetical protein AAF432_06305 [Planctomycetota bacterium]